jgi:hypothetical protein
MKFCASNLLKLAVTLVMIAIGYSVTFGQANICPCYKPPGGEARCEKGQVAMCVVKNGEATAICQNPPANANMLEWALTVIFTPTVIRMADIEDNKTYQQILAAGGVRTADTIVTFHIPGVKNEFYDPDKEMRLKLKAIPEITDSELRANIDRLPSKLFSGFRGTTQAP